MTVTLILTRHAKSSWGNPDLDDHARPLNKRGRASAKAVGRWLSAKGYTPGTVLCSDAARTKETWALMADKLLGTPAAQYARDLYLATPEKMLDVVKTSDTAVTMLIAHNPGSAHMARRLVQTPHPHHKFHHYPTTATAVIEFDVDNWAQVAWGQGKVVDFIVPRELI